MKIRTLTIRNVDDVIKTNLRRHAAENGHSMEEEVRSILRRELMAPTADSALGSRLVSRFQGVTEDLSLPERSLPRTPIHWDGSS